MQQRVACIHADVSGYCRHIATDVASAVQTLTAYRAMMIRMVSTYGGHVVDTAGDSLLATFSSAGAAVMCAVDIQRELAIRNAALPPSRRMTFRIGIDLGDVLVEAGRVYGNCVNIAARVQHLAPAGSVYVAGNAYDDLDDRLPLDLHYVGEQPVRSIDEPQRLYRVG